MMEPKEINSKLLELVPAIKPLFSSVTDWLEGIDTGSTIVVEDVFMVYVREQLEAQNAEELKKCSDFVEWLSYNVEDDYAGDVLVISIFEYVHFSEDKARFETLFGEKANQVYLSINWN
ncbi:MAG: hypothetical protein MJ228_02910 [Bacilli bacterium]|nr:hypothetical protein [Bacilli bacterium]